jgi:hypothetical protein
MSNILGCVFLVAFVVNIGCTSTIDRSMVIGKYYANHKKGVDSLELRSDGTYLYYYKAPDGKELKNTNKWEFEYVEGKATITFLQFIFGLPGYGSPKPGFWTVQVQKTFWRGELRLCIDPDLAYFYVKEKS